MKAKEMQAQFDAQKQTVRRQTKRRGWMTGLAAAAAVLVCGTVTVGAVNNWDYSAGCSRYFSVKAGGEVNYDVTGMGLDLGDVIEGEGYTITLQSLVADANTVYIAYDVALSDEVNAMIEPYGDAEMSLTLYSIVYNTDEEGTLQLYGTGGAHPMPVKGEDGVWHGVIAKEIEDGTDLSDKKLCIRGLYPVNLNGEMEKPLYIAYHFNGEGMGEWMRLAAQDFDLQYDLSGIAVQEGVTVPYGGTLPNDANENIFDTMTVTPFKLRFTLERTPGACETVPEWGFMPGNDAVPVTYTAVYADGTEQVLTAGIGSGSHTSGGTSYHPDGTPDETQLNCFVYFTSPIRLEGLTAIRVNDTEIPVP